MASAWGSAWSSAWGDSWGVLATATVQQPSGGTRLPNKYVPIDLRRSKAAAKRRLDAERKRLAELKRQQVKVEVQYKAITLEMPKAVAVPKASDRARLLELEVKEYEQRVALQASRVKIARKEAETAKREADRLADERELESAYERFLAEEEEAIHAARAERVRLEQESDDEMQAVLLLIHEDF